MVALGKRLGEMAFIAGGGIINWFPGHMAAATRAIRDRLKLADFVIEVRDARIPLSSVNVDIQNALLDKRRVIALNKKDLANQNIMRHWLQHFDSCSQECLLINAHNKSSVQKLLAHAELKLKEVISREPTLLIMVVGVPNVGKSTLINSIHQIAVARFPAQDKIKRATVGPLPGVTQDIAGYKIAHRPSIYVLDTPGILVPSIPDIETGLKLALTGAVNDSVVGEERLAQYLLAILNTRGTPHHWRHLQNRRIDRYEHKFITEKECSLQNSLPKRRQLPSGTDLQYLEDLVTGVQRALYVTHSEFEGNIEEENDLESLINTQFMALRKAFKIPPKTGDEAHSMVSKKLLTLFRTGKLGPFTLDSIPNVKNRTCSKRSVHMRVNTQGSSVSSV